MYYFLFAIFYLLSLLPFWMLYLISDFARFVLFEILKYRKEVIQSNIDYAFPDLTEQDKIQIISNFQKSFCDQWIETIKLMSISKETLNKRMQFDFGEIDNESRNVYILLGHQFNWEWSNALANQKTDKQFAGIYQRVKNKAFDKLMYHIRSRFGNELIAAHNFLPKLRKLQEQPFVLAMIADQSPGNNITSLWYQFLNRPTRFSIGPQKIIGKRNVPVYFAECKKESRGYYKVSFTLITHNAANEEGNFITDEFVKLLENSIKSQPYNWLWSHKRWKHRMNAEDSFSNIKH